MGELWRSKDMSLVQMFIPVESAHQCVEELGNLECVQFRDLQQNLTAFQRHFVQEIRTAEEIERKLHYFKEEAKLLNLQLKNNDSNPILMVEKEDEKLTNENLYDLNKRLDSKEQEVIELSKNQNELYKQRNQIVELLEILKQEKSFFEGSDDLYETHEDDDSIEMEGEEVGKLKFKAGVIDREKFTSFSRLIFRISRGNVFLKHNECSTELIDIKTGRPTEKNVFVAIYRGNRLKDKLQRAFDSYNANLYPIPHEESERKDLRKQARKRKKDMDTVIEESLERRKRYLTKICLHLTQWAEFTLREKKIYHSLNLFDNDNGRKCLIAEAWVPSHQISRVKRALKAAKKRSGSRMGSILNILETRETPPTYINTNEFTKGFQAIINAYGIPRYKEINPAVFTIITFPFEFGIMFGDVGHGLMLLSIILAIFYWGDSIRRKNNEIAMMFYKGRYVILLMSLFSIYMGALYNEAFDVPLDFGSAWDLKADNHTWVKTKHVYSFGVDPVWRDTELTLLYYNSLKMKMAIIVGVCQMSLGLFMKLLNSAHFGHALDIIFEFIPQILFLLSIFGYLCFLIFLKWTIGNNGSPLLLNILINMIIPGSAKGTYFYPNQQTIELILVLIVLISIPLMLIPKPIIISCMHSALKKKDIDEEEKEKKDIGGFPYKDFKMSEVIVHQVLETIEFCLGTVSHTASYLRLWALSLAHSQLSKVLWDMLFSNAMTLGFTILKGVPPYVGIILSAVGAFIGYAAWMALTLFILIFMEALSAGLHSLRLHWVEFQSKFYKGDGYKFRPLNFSKEN